VAGFIGAPAMNLLPAQMQGGQVVLRDGTTLAAGHGGSGDVWCGMRPEDLTWVPPGTDADGGCLRGTALVVEPLGPDTLVSLELAGTEVSCRLPPRSVRRAGETVTLTLDPARVHLFDRTSGQRLRQDRQMEGT
jgi:ABC-type sugar transport system ATPase subunit